MEKEPTLTDVLEAVNKGFTHVETRLGGLDTRIGSLETKVDGIQIQLGDLDKKIDGVRTELKKDINTLTNHVDGFAKKQLTFDAELAAERSARKRLEERIA